MQVVSQLKPHTLVFNSGLWRTMGKDPAWPRGVYDKIFKAANAAVAPQVCGLWCAAHVSTCAAAALCGMG